jgi:hypothetical protein
LPLARASGLGSAAVACGDENARPARYRLEASPLLSENDTMISDRIRVASLQYFIRPIRTFAQFRDQVRSSGREAVAGIRAAHVSKRWPLTAQSLAP